MSVSLLSPSDTDRESAATNLADLDESTLVDRAKAGDNDAFGELYHRHQASVCACARAMMRCQLADAEDVASEAWIVAFKAIRRFRNDGSASFKAWLYGVTRYRVLEWHARKARREEPAAEVDPGIDTTWRARPEALVLGRVEVQDLLTKLPARQRQVLLLRFGCDLTIPEVSRIMRAAELQTTYVERTSQMMVGRLTRQALAAIDERLLAMEIRRRTRRFLADPNATWPLPASTSDQEAA
jgi:RNA polymerase sigma-70 factor, ECF subfamily